jgi:hypothetical protein
MFQWLDAKMIPIAVNDSEYAAMHERRALATPPSVQLNESWIHIVATALCLSRWTRRLRR